MMSSLRITIGSLENPRFLRMVLMNERFLREDEKYADHKKEIMLKK